MQNSIWLKDKTKLYIYIYTHYYYGHGLENFNAMIIIQAHIIVTYDTFKLYD